MRRYNKQDQTTHAVHCLRGRVPCICTGPGLQSKYGARLDGGAGAAFPVLLHGPWTTVRRHVRYRSRRRNCEGLLQGAQPVQNDRLAGCFPDATKKSGLPVRRSGF